MAAPPSIRLTALFMIAVVASSILAGCGGSEPKAQPAQNKPAGSKLSPSTAQRSTAARADLGPVGSPKRLFAENCAGCHGEKGVGGHMGVDLKGSAAAADSAIAERTIRRGGASMPAFDGQLSAAEIAKIADYVSRTIAPGKTTRGK